MSAVIRAFTEKDYAAMHALHRTLDPASCISVEEMRRRDQYNDPRSFAQRWCIEQDGSVVAVGEYNQEAQHYHPQVFTIDAMVHPHFQHQGIGTMFYQHVMQALAPLKPGWLKKRIRWDNPSGISFLEQRGFQGERQLWESRLDLSTLDPGRSSDDERRLQQQGIVVRSFSELSDDHERDRKLYQLVKELAAEVPSAEPRETRTYEEYVRYTLHAPIMLLDGCFVAIHDQNYIGISEVRATEKQHELTTRLTAVQRAYRRRGIASALKLRCIIYALGNGYTALWTSNDSRNLSMLALNEHLGFVKQHLWLELMRTFPYNQ